MKIHLEKYNIISKYFNKGFWRISSYIIYVLIQIPLYMLYMYLHISTVSQFSVAAALFLAFYGSVTFILVLRSSMWIPHWNNHLVYYSYLNIVLLSYLIIRMTVEWLIKGQGILVHFHQCSCTSMDPHNTCMQESIEPHHSYTGSGICICSFGSYILLVSV